MDRCSLPSFELSQADSVGPRWERWLARFEVASKIAGDDRQKALHVAGGDVFDIYTALPTQRDTTFNATKAALTAHSLLRGTGSLRFFGFGHLLDS